MNVMAVIVAIGLLQVGVYVCYMAVAWAMERDERRRGK